MLLLAVIWGVAGYFSFRSGVGEANDRIPGSTKTQLTKQDGLLTSTPTTILVLGTDGAAKGGRADANRTDSIMLLHTDPRRHRLAFLSIPRDLRVEIPEVGAAKVNAAFQYGGATLALRTIRDLTGIPINHIAVVDFDRFKELIDSVGGIDVNVPKTDPFEQVRLPVLGEALRNTGTAGASRRGRSTWTASARSSTRGSGRTCSTLRRPISTAPGASSRCCRRLPTRSRASGRRCASRS